MPTFEARLREIPRMAGCTERGCRYELAFSDPIACDKLMLCHLDTNSSEPVVHELACPFHLVTLQPYSRGADELLDLLLTTLTTDHGRWDVAKVNARYYGERVTQ